MMAIYRKQGLQYGGHGETRLRRKKFLALKSEENATSSHVWIPLFRKIKEG